MLREENTRLGKDRKEKALATFVVVCYYSKMTLENFYARLKRYKRAKYLIPEFDLAHGATTESTILLLLESPGPQVRKTGKISLSNHDSSASNLRKQLEEAKAPLKEILLWNIVPWIPATGSGFLTPNAKEIQKSREYNCLLFDVFPNLSTVVFLGRKSQREIPFYSGHTDFRLLAAHHPSAQAMTVRGRWDENVAVFKRLASPVRRT